MWSFNNDSNKWYNSTDNLVKDTFNYLKQELSSTRLYSKALSGSTYVRINNFEDIYDSISSWKPKNWYIDSFGSKYSYTLKPLTNPTPVNKLSLYDYIRNINEYGLTLKNLFTPERLSKEQLKNYIQVDVATIEKIDLSKTYKNLTIDGILIQPGHKILVKDQVSTINLNSNKDPNTYFKGDWEIVENLGGVITYLYLNNENGVYIYDKSRLTKTEDLNTYDKTSNCSIFIKLGNSNFEKQFHLKRMRNGFFPTSDLNEPMEFVENKNWLLRNRVDYNNLFEINYQDILKSPQNTYKIEDITYTIPERVISIGEFGIILNNQNGISNIIPNKYKNYLRGISEVEKYYFICGDDGLLLKVRKHDFNINRINIDTYSNLKSISFFNNLRGVIVGEFNSIYITIDGGENWKRLRIPNFDSYNYYKVIFSDYSKFYVVGRGGVFIEFSDENGWNAYKRRISKQIDDDDEILLSDHINDIYKTNINWNLNYSFSSNTIPNNKDIILLSTDSNNIICYDLNDTTDKEFIYLDLGGEYGDIKNITGIYGSNSFYFSNDLGIYKFNIDDFKKLGIGNSFSNSSLITKTPELIFNGYANNLYDYNGTDLLFCGNYSLTKTYNYIIKQISELDINFNSRLKPKLLFMDYDIGGKLNFFTDEGDYRLPNSVSFDKNFVNVNSKFSFSNIVYGATAPSFMTQSEVNWVDYYLDSKKTFRYNSTNLNKESIVLISKTFSGTRYNITATVSNVITDYNIVSKLAPTIKYSGLSSSKYRSNENIVDYPVSDISLFLYDDIMILGVTNSTTSLSYNYFLATEGDVLKISSNVIEGDFIINRVYNKANVGRFYYMYSNFNENIISDLKSDNNITFTNLNRFSNIDNLINNFNNHPIGISYKMTEDDINININPNFNNLTSYYNLATNFNYTSTAYSKNYLRDNYLLTGFRYSIPNGTMSKPLEININENIESSSDIIVNLSLMHRNLNQIVVNLMGPSGEILNVFNGASYSVSDLNGKISRFNSTKFRYSSSNILDTSNYYTDENYAYYTDPFGFYMNKSIGVGFDEFKSTTSNFSDLLLNNSSKGNWKLCVMHYQPDSNTKVNSLYNSGISLVGGTIKETLKYRDSFLKFGYTPTYNILDYLTFINKNNNLNPNFYATKEYLSMPVYKNIPINNNSDSIWINHYGITASYNLYPNDNKIYFGENLKFEWETIFKNTFVDLVIYQPNGSNDGHGIGGTFSSNQMLVMDKYYDSDKNKYVISFHKKLNYELNTPLNGGSIDINSRRSLLEISKDLNNLNNIQKSEVTTRLSEPDDKGVSTTGIDYKNYGSELTFKISTDSYTKILLNDADTTQLLSGILYTDYKNELALNMTQLDRSYNIPIQNTINYNGKLMIICSEKHDLSKDDGFILEFNGGTWSSQILNQHYFGYNSVDLVLDEYKFVTNINYGTDIFVGSDTGYVKYLRKDPFLNYEPVDLIDVSLNKRSKQSIYLNPDNTNINGVKYTLNNIDFTKYRFKLVDNLTFDDINLKFPWILEAEIKDAVLGQDNTGKLIWYKGIWEFGRWFGGIWFSGTWKWGDWYDGIWYSKKVNDKQLKVDVDMSSSSIDESIWYNGRFYKGTWDNGTWLNGRFYDGIWENGTWNNGIWNDGTWNNGKFIGGIWVDGTWNNGISNTDNEPAYWIDGKWHGGDFENGIWYYGSWDEKVNTSRFGTLASNSRTAIWNGGKWQSGSFYSRLDGLPDVSESHKFSIWKTGTWGSGNWFGGVAYNINFKSGVWHGGIVEDIQIIGINNTNNSITLNGVFRYEIGDEFYIIDKYSNEFTFLGTKESPKKFIVLKNTVDEENKVTEVFINENIDLTDININYKSLSFNYDNLISYNTIHYYSFDINDVDYNSINVRVKIDLEVTQGGDLGDIVLNLRTPNNKILNLKEIRHGSGDKFLKNTIFSLRSGDTFSNGSPMYSNTFKMSLTKEQGGLNGLPINLKSNSNFNDIKTYIQNNEIIESTNGIWSLLIEKPSLLTYKMNKCQLEFTNDNGIGSQIGQNIVSGFETGLRVVSKFNNALWKTGIWSNGIFENGKFETGIWYDGVFNGDWG